MKLKPFSDCVLIKQDVKNKQGLIIVPESKLTSGIIMAAGPGKRTDKGVLMPMNCAVGDHVMFGEYSGQKVTIEGQEYLMMRDADLIGIYEDEANG